MTFPLSLNPGYLEELYLLWKCDPSGVPADWSAFFDGFELAAEGAAGIEALRRQGAVRDLVERYREIGHLLACTDPLSPCSLDHPWLSLDAFALGPADLDATFAVPGFCGGTPMPLREIVETLRETYAGAVGVEYLHIQDPGERTWLQERLEICRNRPSLTGEEKLRILEELTEATAFEAFLHRRFVGQKRFSLEGGETLLPMLHETVRRAAGVGCRDMVVGMAHRGRLNVLANLFGKPYQDIFAEFRDNLYGVVGDGDVKYHKGYSADRDFGGAAIHLTLAPNPSHLEAVDPVVEGKARARQDRLGSGREREVLPILIHGDAAFAGQGVVAETLNLSQLEGYRTGGTLHIVINNQIGFTTEPADSRSSCYATDIAKFVSAPIFHVHGEDPEAAVHVVRIALEYRQRFAKDVVVEIICYRRYGHNEGDEPFFTQPLMYEKIRSRPPVDDIYASILAGEGMDAALLSRPAQGMRRRLEDAFRAAPGAAGDAFGGRWSGVESRWRPFREETGVAAERLRLLAQKAFAVPPGFTPHRKIAEMMEKRGAAVDAGEAIDWGTAEILAYATLVAEGVRVRLSGQDSRRGTFNHRHAVIYDMHTGSPCVPLAAAADGGGVFEAWDSSLSEMGILGFEYGYSLEAPEALVIWEAQFGDFANGAQVIIDQFLAAGETKWQRHSGVTLFLPHGYEGQGAEHSSARIERWLQLCAGNNLQVVYPSTPAQMFHLLRRQLLQPFRRPLVVFTPKSLLRHPRCVSGIGDLVSGRFREVLPAGADPAATRAVLVCSGKMYYDLLEHRIAAGRDDVALLRVEQLYPLAEESLRAELARYADVPVVRWVQEEPANMGAWRGLRDALARAAGRELEYVGREEDAAPAVGSHRLHGEQQEALVLRAFDIV